MMSILEATEDFTAPEGDVQAPYRTGDRICATSPEGTRYLARVEAVKPTGPGQFSVLAAVTEPRRYRSHLLTTVVGADGYGPAVRPAV
jgi:hypothetical protein